MVNNLKGNLDHAGLMMKSINGRHSTRCINGFPTTNNYCCYFNSTYIGTDEDNRAQLVEWATMRMRAAMTRTMTRSTTRTG
eukprot:5445994-Amphidinium_carterae.2